MGNFNSKGLLIECCVYIRVFAIEVFYDIFLNGQKMVGEIYFLNCIYCYL